MKTKLQYTIRCEQKLVEWLDEGRVMFVSGNNLCIRDVNGEADEYITLHEKNTQMLAFIASPNRKGIFTLERVGEQIQLCSYRRSGNRKEVRMYDLIGADKFGLIADEFDNSIIFGWASFKTHTSVFLVDMTTQKILSHTNTNHFLSTCHYSIQSWGISISGDSFLNTMNEIQGQWIVQDVLPPQLKHAVIFFHEWLSRNQVIMVTPSHFYFSEERAIMQSFPLWKNDSPVALLNASNRVIFIFSEDCRIKIFLFDEEKDDIAELKDIKIPLSKKTKVSKVRLNKNQEQIFLQTQEGNIYYWKIASIDKNTTTSFIEIPFPYCSDPFGFFSLTATKNLCLLSNGKNVTLYNLLTNKNVISTHFQYNENDKDMKTCGINPDGHSFCLAFQEKIKFYRILLNKFHQYGEFLLRKVSLMQYSHGGHLIACYSGRGMNSFLTIINTLTLTQVYTFKLSNKVKFIVWNQHDDQVYIGTVNGIVILYSVANQKKILDYSFKEEIHMIRYDNLTKKILVSVGPTIYLIDQKRQTSEAKPKIEDFEYVFPADGMYFAADSHGGLYHSMSIDFEKSTYLQLFASKHYELKYRKGLLVALASMAEIVTVSIKMEDTVEIQQEGIAFIQLEEIDRYIERIKHVQNQFYQYKQKALMEFQFERKRYEKCLEEKKQKFVLKIENMQKFLHEIQSEKTYKEKDKGREFQDSENNQIKNLNSIQKLYDQKIRMQKEKYATLEQQHEEEKENYERIIMSLQKSYHERVEKIRDNYKIRLEQEIERIQEKKKQKMQEKKQAELKIINLQEENQLTLFSLQEEKMNTIKKLIERNTKLQRECDSIRVDQHNMKGDLSEIDKKYEQNIQNIKKYSKMLENSSSQVAILQDEMKQKMIAIDENNIIIKQQSQMIDSLQKAKHVLGFRTNEIRSEMQPKEEIIEELKKKRSDEDKNLTKQNQRKDTLVGKIKKFKALLENAKKVNIDLKSNLNRSKINYDNLCIKIFEIVTGRDREDWHDDIELLYNNYVKGDNMEEKYEKKVDNTSEQLSRHLMQVERTLKKVTNANRKVLKGKEKQMMKKMIENGELVTELNKMRKEEKGKVGSIKNQDKQISKLKREIHQSHTIKHHSTRANTAVTGARKLISRGQLASRGRDNFDSIDLSFRRQSDFLLPEKSEKIRTVTRDDKREKTIITNLETELQLTRKIVKDQQKTIERINRQLLEPDQESG